MDSPYCDVHMRYMTISIMTRRIYISLYCYMVDNVLRFIATKYVHKLSKGLGVPWCIEEYDGLWYSNSMYMKRYTNHNSLIHIW